MKSKVPKRIFIAPFKETYDSYMATTVGYKDDIEFIPKGSELRGLLKWIIKKGYLMCIADIENEINRRMK
jgi:hypothetical protein